MEIQYSKIFSVIYEVAEKMSPSEILTLKGEIASYLELCYARALEDELYTEDEDEPWWNR